jgi:hypothetical protein
MSRLSRPSAELGPPAVTERLFVRRGRALRAGGVELTEPAVVTNRLPDVIELLGPHELAPAFTSRSTIRSPHGGGRSAMRGDPRRANADPPDERVMASRTRVR